MKPRILIFIVALGVFAALANPDWMRAQEEKKVQSQHYSVTDLGTLGGTFSSGEGISNQGWVDGFSTLSGDAITHAFLRQHDTLTDLGKPGLNSLVSYPFNAEGGVAMHGETSDPDPLGEDFCGFGSHLKCAPSVWQSGVLTRLPTIYGGNGFANQINNRGEVVGVIENTTHDMTCHDCVEGVCQFQVFQTEAVMWKKNYIHRLPSLAGDPDGLALIINENGEAAGTSGQCIGSANEALHAVIWQNGTVSDLGNLGGTTNNHPQYLNNRGEVVGFSNLPGDATTHAFLWRKGVMSDLGTLSGDFSSFGEAINDSSEIGGLSCDLDGNCRAFVWQKGVMTDLNTLVSAGSPLFLIDALSINSRGEIVGDALETSSGDVHAYLATPIPGGGTNEIAMAATRSQAGESPRIALPDSIRKVLRERLAYRYHIPIHPH